ncbi:MAG: phytanoyl-CoA dioxygenase family protein [Planctomycetota bacterium]
MPALDQALTDDQWLQYTREGYLKLGKLLPAERLSALQARIDDIMLGKADVDYDRMLMQEDSADGAYGNAGEMSKGHKGSHLNYRKIEQLEFDPIFLRLMQERVFLDACRRAYGMHVPVGAFRAMFMNKPANRGTFLPWHQDRWNHLDRDPLVTVWIALDPATKANGCVQVIPETHKYGVVNPKHGSGFMSDEQVAEMCDESKRVYLELEAGEVVLLHNWLMHGSDRNNSDQSRRAFSVCYADARTKDANGGDPGFSPIFGEGALDPDTLPKPQVATTP